MSANVKNLEAKDFHGEIEKYKRLLESLPRHSTQTIPIHLALGKLYERAGDKTAAIQEFAIFALFYADQGQIIKAMAAAQLIKRLDPQNEELLGRLEELYVLRRTVSDSQLQEYQESLNHIEELQSGQQEASAPAKDEIDDAGITAETADAAVDVISALKQIPVFAGLSVSELRGIHTNSTLRDFAANEPVITGGNVRRSLFAILQGSVKVLGKDKDQRETFLAALNAGSSFGEFALFGRIDPNLSVITEQACTILEIPREIVLKLAKIRPHVTEALKDLYRRRILDTALARVPLFSQLAPQDRRKIITYFKPVKAKQGTTLVREAEPGESMYFIIAGEVGVYTSLTEAGEGDETDTEAEPLLLATLKSGDFFGEQVLVTNEPRSATVTALTDVALLKFSKRDLAAVIQEYPWIESALQIEAFQNVMRKKLSIFKQLLAPGNS
jgi:CRP-like cAMP-binding protein